MKSEPVRPPPDLAASAPACFQTREERIARRHGTPGPYFRLEDSVCRRFLERATDPVEFAGLRLIFPFVREASLLRPERKLHLLGWWMSMAFHAGLEFGRTHPEHLEELLPGRGIVEALRRLGAIRDVLPDAKPFLAATADAFRTIVQRQWIETTEWELEELWVDAIIKSFRAGFGAATVARFDPQHSEFVADLPVCSPGNFRSLFGWTLIQAPRRAAGLGIAQRLEHPLVRMAWHRYPGRITERAAMQDFLRRQLHRLGVMSETDCPTAEADLPYWIEAGMDHGRRLKCEKPHWVARILRETGAHGLASVEEVILEVLSRAGGTDPFRLKTAILEWMQEAHRWTEPRFYGRALERVIHVADFAMWIPWIID